MSLLSLREDVTLRQGPSVGAVWAVYDLARPLGLETALGSTRQGKLALWQILARVVDPGSRLSAVRVAASHIAIASRSRGPRRKSCGKKPGSSGVAHGDQALCRQRATRLSRLFRRPVSQSPCFFAPREDFIRHQNPLLSDVPEKSAGLPSDNAQ